MALDKSKKRQVDLEYESIQLELETGLFSDRREEIKALITEGWRSTYLALFGHSFVDGLAPHHIEAIKWHWNARLDLIEGSEPDHDAYFPIWSRAHNKSGVARRIAVTDGVLSYAFNQPAYILYLSRNKEMAIKHAKSVSTLLQSNRIRQVCPELSEVQSDKKQVKGWTASFIFTKANAIFHFAGLDEGLAGGNLETDIQEHGVGDVRSDVRVTLFVPDDIDGREDSPTQAERRFNALTSEVLAMGQENSLVFFAQNLISRFSTMYRIHSQQERVLTGRKPTKPIPAVRNLKVEKQTTKDGIIQDVFVSGESTWHVWDRNRVQREINRFGYKAFLRECQHEVEQSKEGLMHKNYDDDVHPISYSQFATVYGSPDAWKHWYKVPASDWARTKTKYHANVAGYLSISSENTPLPGMSFLIPYSFPADTEPEDLAERLLTSLTPYAAEGVTWRDLIDSAWKRMESHIKFDSVGERMAYRGRYYQNIIAEYSRPVLQKFHVRTGVNSHSEDKVRNMLNIGFGFSFIPSNPRKTEALEEIDSEMRVDYSLPHLFDPDKKGYTRWYVLCSDDMARKPRQVGNTVVYPPTHYPDVISPDDLHDDKLFRYQMMNRRFVPPTISKLGEKIDEPEKLNDDFGQLLQMIYLKRLLANIEYSTEEMLEQRIAEKIRFAPSQMEGLTVEQGISLQMAKVFAIKEMRKEGYELDRFGNELEPDDGYDDGYDYADLSEGW